MASKISASITRRSMVAGLALSASPIALAGADTASAQAKQTTPEKSLYERLGGVFAIAAVVDHFSDAVVKNPIVGQKSKNPQLRKWHTEVRTAARPQVYADAVGLRRFGWAVQVHGHQARRNATRPRGGPPGPPDLPERI